MNFEQYITQAVANLTTRLNQIVENARKIYELPWQSILKPGSKLQVSNTDNVSEFITVQQILDAALSYRQNQLISANVSVLGNDVTVDAGAEWVINNINYETASDTVINVPYAETGNTRTDILVADETNTIYRVNGPETAGVSPAPNVPLNTVLVTTINVTDSTVGYVPPVIGNDYEVKINKQDSLTVDGTGVKYPTVDAVNAALASITVSDATTTTKGVIKLDGDLSGTADLPTVPGLANKQDTLISGTNIKTINGTTILGSGDITISGAVTEAPIDTHQYVRQDADWERISAEETLLQTYIPSAGVINTGDSAQEAIEKLDGNLQNAAIYLPEQGLIISDDFNRASLGTNYTNIGTSTFTIVSNQLQVVRTGGFSTSNYIVYNAYGNCNLESFTINTSIIPGTINSTSFGVGITLQSNGSFSLIPGGRNSIQIGICLDSSNLGKISFYNNNSASATATSATGLAISTGDNLLLTVKFIKDKFIVTLLNVSTGLVNTFEYDIYNSSPYGIISPNSFRYGIVALGGTHLVDNFSIVSNDSVGISYLLCGDSITKGLSCDNIENRWGELLNNNTTTATQTNAGGGNCIEDLNVAEIIALDPVNIILLIGVNNFQILDSVATASTKYQTLVNSLVSAGYVVGTNLFLCKLLPFNLYSASIISFNSWLVSTYGSANCIDFYAPLSNGTSMRYTIDGIHPDNEGHRIMANIVTNKFNLPSRIKKRGAIYPVIYNNNGKLVIGSENSRSSTPNYQLEVINNTVGLTNGAQLRIGNSIVDNGAYLFSNGADSGALFAGMNYANANYIAKAVNIGGYFTLAGDTYFYGSTGHTIGANIIPTVRMFIKGSNGNVGINTTTPVATAQFQIDSTTKGFLPPRMTTTQKNAIASPAEGLMIYDSTLKKLCMYNGTAWETVTSI